MMIRKLITALFMAGFLLALTSAWMPKAAHAQCIAGLNGLICPNPPTPSGVSGAGSHKRPAKTQLPIPTNTPSPTPTISPTSTSPVGLQTVPITGRVGAPQNPSQGSSDWPWSATVVNYGFWVMLALTIVVVTTAALRSRIYRISNIRNLTVPSGGAVNIRPTPPAPEPPTIPYPNGMLDNAMERVETSDIPITKTVDHASAGIAREASTGLPSGNRLHGIKPITK